jgi:tetratricopeptide (TPR) repeat protein
MASLALFSILLSMRMGRVPSFFGSLLFLVHPIHTEAVILASNREELLFALFYLIAFASHIRGGKKSLSISLLFFLLSMFSKEMAASFPIVIIAYDWRFASPKENLFSLLRRRAVYYFSFFIVVGFFLALRYTIMNNSEGAAEYIGGSPYATFLTMSNVFCRYLGLLVAPVRQCADYVVEPLTSLRSPAAFLSVAALIVFIYISFALRKRQSAIAFSMIFFLISLLPVSNIIPFGAAMAERYMYVPAVALSIATASLISTQRGTIIKYVLVVLAIGACFAMTISRASVWQNDFSLWGDTIECAPRSATAHMNLGNAFLKSGHPEKALELYDKARTLGEKRNLSKLHYNIGLASRAIGRDADAESSFRESINQRPDFAEPSYHLAKMAAESGRLEEGLELLENAISADPSNALSRYVAARYLADYFPDRHEEYTAHLEKASELDPRSALYAAALGDAFFRVGDYAKAEKALLKSVGIDPESEISYHILLQLYIKTGRDGDAARAAAELRRLLDKK